MSIVTLTTDFGTADGYVGAMKGVISSIDSDARIVDAAHGIAQGDIAAGAWILSTYWQLFPRSTVHVVVVDPGVGTDRRPMACAAGGHYFVAPDNGVLHHVLKLHPEARLYELARARYQRRVVSHTFHGRDVFAPAAAWISRGYDPREMGPAIEDPVRLDVTPPDSEEGTVTGCVVHADAFGNLITNIPGTWILDCEAVEAGGHTITGLVQTYSDVSEGVACALVGSAGTLEISVRNGNAQRALGVGVGDAVSVRLAATA